ncbi:MAG: hypothetical protein RLZZ546_1137, partial [Bacteroidota bacterium]
DGICFAEENDWYNMYHLLMALGTILSSIGVVMCAAYSFEAEFE